jgi:hypothetical protein
VPIQFDSELTVTQHSPNLLSYQKLQPLALGTASGSLLIVALGALDCLLFRLKPFEASISYVYEMQPHFDCDLTRSILIFGTAVRGVMVEVSANKPPLELLRMEEGEEKLVRVNERLVALLDGGEFNLVYFRTQMDSPECQGFREEHYSPGLRG